MAANKQKQQVLSFDDLLSQLAHAIEHDDEEILSHRIRGLFPVAMIDEFQDTDPLQYQIFQSLYLNNPECGWFMIGDPKQAIYGFRGADIFTYIEARQAVNSHFTLSVNWRSSQAMVCSANQVFASADKPFIYDSDIPFHPVDANPMQTKCIGMSRVNNNPPCVIGLPMTVTATLMVTMKTTVISRYPWEPMKP